MASLQAVSLRSTLSAALAPSAQAKTPQRQPGCPSMFFGGSRNLNNRIQSERLLSKSSESLFSGTRLAGEPLGVVKVLSTRRRQCKARASEGRQAARDVERKSKNIFENIIDFFKYIINSILKFFSSILGGISRLFRGSEGSAKANLRRAGDKADGAGRDLGNAAEDAADAVGDKGKDFKRNISDGLDDASSRLKRA